MSTTTNKGNQTVTFGFKAPARASVFNKINHKLHKAGIYDWANRGSGGELLTYVDPNTVRVSPIVAVIEANNAELSIRVETSMTHDLVVTSATPYVILRYSWSAVENNYVDIVASDFASITNTDLIIGRAVYDGGTLLSEFDYTRTSFSPLDRPEGQSSTAFQVTPESPVSNRVLVHNGTMRTDESMVTVGNPTAVSSPAISNCDASGRFDIVWIDRTGAVQVTEGEPGAAPEYGRKMVVAEIQRTGASSVVTGRDIVPVYDYRVNFEHGAKLVGIEDAAAYYTGDTVESALAQVGQNINILRTEIDAAAKGKDLTFVETTAQGLQVAVGSQLEANGSLYTVNGSPEIPGGTPVPGSFLFFDSTTQTFVWSTTKGEYSGLLGGIYDASGRRQCRWKAISASDAVLSVVDVRERGVYLPKYQEITKVLNQGYTQPVHSGLPPVAIGNNRAVFWNDTSIYVIEYDPVTNTINEVGNYPNSLGEARLFHFPSYSENALFFTKTHYEWDTGADWHAYEFGVLEFDGSAFNEVAREMIFLANPLPYHPWLSSPYFAADIGSQRMVVFMDDYNTIDPDTPQRIWMRTYHFDGTSFIPEGAETYVGSLLPGIHSSLSPNRILPMGQNLIAANFRGDGESPYFHERVLLLLFFDGTSWTQIGEPWLNSERTHPLPESWTMTVLDAATIAIGDRHLASACVRFDGERFNLMDVPMVLVDTSSHEFMKISDNFFLDNSYSVFRIEQTGEELVKYSTN